MGYASDERQSDYEEAWEDGYDSGFDAGYNKAMREKSSRNVRTFPSRHMMAEHSPPPRSKPKRKLSAWNKFVKANSKKPRFKYKSGAKKGKLNLKAMAVAFRRTPAGKKKKK